MNKINKAIFFLSIVFLLNFNIIVSAASSDYALTVDKTVKLDGINDGTVTVEFKANKNLSIDALEAYFLPNTDKLDTNGYIKLSKLETTLSGGEIDKDATNGLVYLVNTSGYSLSFDDVIWRATYTINKNTPSGTYPIKLSINSLTLHNTTNVEKFDLTSSIVVKSANDPYVANFSTDSGVESIDVYYSEDYSRVSESRVTNAYVRNSSTGNYDNSGNGEINFKVNLKSGYIVSSITATPTANREAIKGPSDTEVANVYRITKVKDDITITVTTKKATEYTATILKDSNIQSVDIYYTHDYNTPSEQNVSSAFARNANSGQVDISGEGEVNFLVIPKDGYKVNTPVVTGGFSNISSPVDTGKDNLYRVGKIYGDVVIKLTTKKRISIVPTISDYNSSYSYTGSSIKPKITVKISGSDTTLIEGTDYSVSYGDNINIGTGAGKITINSLATSDYIFNSLTVNFDIIKYQLSQSNISIPRGILYTGNALQPNIVITANNKTLVKDTDYKIELTNQNGQVGEYVIAKVIGQGNYTGEVDNLKILIVDKPLQTLKFSDLSIKKTYGDNYTMIASLEEGDGTVTYSSSDEKVAIVNSTTGAVTLVGAGEVTITATASRTENFYETSESYKLTVEKRVLKITSAKVLDKNYDGSTAATVSSVTFENLANSENLNKDVDYSVQGVFADKNVGDNKNVNLTVQLLNTVTNKYVLENSNFTSHASIFGILINDSDVTLQESTFVYSGTAKEPNVTVVVGGETLVKNTDYTVTYQNNINAGKATAIIVGTGNYSTKTPIKKEFTISKKEIVPVIGKISDAIYSGKKIEPDLTVTTEGVTLIKDTDYTIEYSNNINVGTGTVQINPVASSNYTFDNTLENAKATFKINPYAFKANDISLSYVFVKYDGKEKRPDVTVTANGIKLVKDVDYEVSYSNNINLTTEAKVTVTAKSSNYTGSAFVYFEISDKDELIISGIENQNIAYTGNPVELVGNLKVSDNTKGITPNDLTVVWYNSSDEEINRPVNVGKYYVIYSYADNAYIGKLKVNFEIVKAESKAPSEMTANLSGIAGEALSTVSLSTNGLSWDDDKTILAVGSNRYAATYTQNNDSSNYTTIKLAIPVYGKTHIDINTSVNGGHGQISNSFENVLEGSSKTITFTPDEGYEISKVMVNGEEKIVENDSLTITAGNVDLNIVVTYKIIQYKLTIIGANVELDPIGIIEVNYNSSKSITIKAKYGYSLSSVLVNNIENISNLVGDTLVLTNILRDTEIVITAEKITYNVIEGSEQKYIINQDSIMSFKIDADYNLFKNGGVVYFDGTIVDKNDYTSQSGSTIITFSSNFLKNLTVGEHTLNVEFSDGGVATTMFTIEKNEIQVQTVNNPQTSDTIVITLFMFDASLLGLLSGAFYIRRKNEI